MTDGKSPFITDAAQQYRSTADILDLIKKAFKNPVPLLIFVLIFVVILKVIFGLLGNWWPQFNNVELGIGFSTIALVVTGVGALALVSSLTGISKFTTADEVAKFFYGLKQGFKIVVIVILLVLAVSWLVTKYPGIFGDLSILPRQMVWNPNIDPFSIVPIR